MNHMTYRGYTARMDFDTEDKIIVGRVIDIDDIITFHGSSVAEFEAAFNAAVDSYTLACEQLGQAADKPASGRMMLRVNPAVHAAAVKASARSGESLNLAYPVDCQSGAPMLNFRHGPSWFPDDASRVSAGIPR